MVVEVEVEVRVILTLKVHGVSSRGIIHSCNRYSTNSYVQEVLQLAEMWSAIRVHVRILPR